MKTTDAQIRAALRQLFLRSRERSETLKAHNYACAICDGKQSKAAGREFKVEVHHKQGVNNWKEIFKVIRDNLLCEPEDMEVLCKECHKKQHHSSLS